MALNNQEIFERLSALVEPGGRERLLARGLARSLIWRQGVLPPNAPGFSESLSYDLESHAFQILELALAVTGDDRSQPLVLNAYRVAAEELEAIVRRGEITDPHYGFLMVVSAAAYQLARLAARSYVVLPQSFEHFSMSATERVLAYLLRREFNNITSEIVSWGSQASSQSQELVQRLQNAGEFPPQDSDSAEDPQETHDEGIAWLLTDNYMRAISHLDLAVRLFDDDALIASKRKLVQGRDAAAQTRHVPLWWMHMLTISIIDDLWATLIWNSLPKLDGAAPGASEWERLRFDYIRTKIAKPRPELDLWPSQLEAAQRSVDHTFSMVLALPTSAGKTKLAELCILRTLSLGMRVFYITPLRALSAQVERILAASFVPLGFSVSSLYGASGVSKVDIDIAQTDQIIVATPEKLDYVLRNEPDTLNDVGLVVLDEGHMIGLGVREIRYETLVQRMVKRDDASERRIVCLSAIFDSGDAFDDFVSWISRGDPQAAIRSDWRPTRQRAAVCIWENTSAKLQFYVEDEEPFVPKYLIQRKVKRRRTRQLPDNKNELVVALSEKLVEEGHTVLVYCPQRRSVNSTANLFLDLIEREAVSFPLGTPEALQEAWGIGREWLGDTHVAVRCLQAGVAVHHGMLPRPFLASIEKLISARQIKLVVASPTLAQGLDLSCSALIFQSLHRSGSMIPPSEFTNVIGRVGRAFVDIDGLSVFPIFETTPRKVRSRISDFRSLWEQARHRQLESGLLQLITSIIGALAQKLGLSASALIEQVTRIDFDWKETIEAAGTTTDNEELDLVDLGKLVAQLDEALLSILDPDVNPAVLAQVLDDALRDSYWQRRLARATDPTVPLQQRELLLARVRWIWSRSDSTSRRGFSTAGVGLETGNRLLQDLGTLAPILSVAEDALTNDDIESALPAIEVLIEALADIPPFDMSLPTDWRLLLRQWLMGKPIWGNGNAAVEPDLEFVSDGLVYRSVWGLEAIRTLAIAKEVLDPSFQAQALTESLTFGCNAFFGRWLLRKGFSSRRMAIEISDYVRDRGFLQRDLNGLLHRLIDEQLIEQHFRSEPEKLSTWLSFLDQDTKIVRGKWAERHAHGSLQLTKIFDEKTSSVHLFHTDGDNAAIYSADLDHVMDVTLPSEEYFQGYLKATMQPDGELHIVSFGPAAS